MIVICSSRVTDSPAASIADEHERVDAVGLAEAVEGEGVLAGRARAPRAASVASEDAARVVQGHRDGRRRRRRVA